MFVVDTFQMILIRLIRGIWIFSVKEPTSKLHTRGILLKGFYPKLMRGTMICNGVLYLKCNHTIRLCAWKITLKSSRTRLIALSTNGALSCGHVTWLGLGLAHPSHTIYHNQCAFSFVIRRFIIIGAIKNKLKQHISEWILLVALT